MKPLSNSSNYNNNRRSSSSSSGGSSSSSRNLRMVAVTTRRRGRSCCSSSSIRPRNSHHRRISHITTTTTSSSSSNNTEGRKKWSDSNSSIRQQGSVVSLMNNHNINVIEEDQHHPPPQAHVSANNLEDTIIYAEEHSKVFIGMRRQLVDSDIGTRRYNVGNKRRRFLDNDNYRFNGVSELEQLREDYEYIQSTPYFYTNLEHGIVVSTVNEAASSLRGEMKRKKARRLSVFAIFLLATAVTGAAAWILSKVTSALSDRFSDLIVEDYTIVEAPLLVKLEYVPNFPSQKEISAIQNVTSLFYHRHLKAIEDIVKNTTIVVTSIEVHNNDYVFAKANSKRQLQGDENVGSNSTSSSLLTAILQLSVRVALETNDAAISVGLRENLEMRAEESSQQLVNDMRDIPGTLYFKRIERIELVEWPSSAPTELPSTTPTLIPSLLPTLTPSVSQVPSISLEPSSLPTITAAPTSSHEPSLAPSYFPTNGPSLLPSVHPTIKESQLPSESPTKSVNPSNSLLPSSNPTKTDKPSTTPLPSMPPTIVPSGTPSELDSASPSDLPSFVPSSLLSPNPSINSITPSNLPTKSSEPSKNSTSPSQSPSNSISSQPSISPSLTKAFNTVPSSSPSDTLSNIPSLNPSVLPTTSPTTSQKPSTGGETLSPSSSPSDTLSNIPSLNPSVLPTTSPTTSQKPSAGGKTLSPSSSPSDTLSNIPSLNPSVLPTTSPKISQKPSAGGKTLSPSSSPSDTLTDRPSLKPSVLPTTSPKISQKPSAGGETLSPSSIPTLLPSFKPSVVLVNSNTPSVTPSAIPSFKPSKETSETLPPVLAAPGSTPEPTGSVESMLTTSYDGVNGQSGVMFDILAYDVLNVVEIHIHTLGGSEPTNYVVYSKKDSYVGSEHKSSGWKLLGRVPVLSQGSGKATVLPEGSFLSTRIRRNNISAFYIHASSSTIYYSNGSIEGAIFGSNRNIAIKEGAGISGLFGSKFAPRKFNGALRYTLEYSLKTKFDGELASHGNMFDVFASMSVEISTIKLHLVGELPVTVEVYFRSGNYIGNASSANGWLLAGSENIVPKGYNRKSSISQFDPIEIPTGQIKALYITCRERAAMVYSLGMGEGDLLRSSDYLSIYEGISLAYPFGDKYSPRQWNGVLKYTVDDSSSQTVSPTKSPTVAPVLGIPPGYINIALDQPTQQSSLGWSGPSERAVDGVTNGDYFSAKSVTHTAEPSSNYGIPWWKVTFGSGNKMYKVSHIILWNRTDCCKGRLNGANVYLLDAQGEIVASKNGPNDWENRGQTWSASFNDAVGAAVKVSLSDNSEPLSLAEVQVFGTEVKDAASGSLAPTPKITPSPSSSPTISLNNWIQVIGKGDLAFNDIGKEEFENLLNKSPNNIVRRLCLDCDPSHRSIYYKRITIVPTSINLYENLKNNWFSDKNILNTDFELYSKYEDALAGLNKWEYCNYNDPTVGFPRDCDPIAYHAYQWSTFEPRRGRAHIGFYIEENVNNVPTTPIFAPPVATQEPTLSPTASPSHDITSNPSLLPSQNPSVSCGSYLKPTCQECPPFGVTNPQEYCFGDCVWGEGKCYRNMSPSKVNCGGHQAESCTLCPDTYGKYWCNGECAWDDGTCYKVDAPVSCGFYQAESCSLCVSSDGGTCKNDCNWCNNECVSVLNQCIPPNNHYTT